MNENLPALTSNYDLQTLQIIAKNASISGLYSGVGSEQKILMVLLAAQELGVKPMTALNGGIWNIQGKIEISARLMNAMIRKAGHSIVVKQCDVKACILEGKRKDTGDTFTSQFTIEDATKAGLSGRDVWKKYTEDMLYNRAMSRLARRLFPDVIGTAYVEGEIRDVECEVVDIKHEESKISSLDRLETICKNFPDEDNQMVKEYFHCLEDTYKKDLTFLIERAEADFNKFFDSFNKWKIEKLANVA